MDLMQNSLSCYVYFTVIGQLSNCVNHRKLFRHYFNNWLITVAHFMVLPPQMLGYNNKDGIPVKWHGKERTGSYIYKELSVRGEDLEKCPNNKKLCAMNIKDCTSIPSHGQERFLNISCSYNVLQRLFACKWIYLNNVKAKTTNSFIFSQREYFQRCQSIFNPVAAFNINIISKDIINKVEFISEAYMVSLIEITQAPHPFITSVNATATTLNLTWNKGHWHSTKCQIRYRCSTTEPWTVALEIKEARGVILGYEVTYTPTKQPGLKRIIYTKDQKVNLEVTAEDYDLNITAYNAAGHSPSTNLRVNAGVFQSLPKVKGLWASSEVSSLRIRWEPAAVNVSEFAIEWFSFDDVASKQWKRVNGSTFSTVLKGQIKPLKIYSIAVYSVYGTLCAPAETIQASLDYGTHLDIVQLQPVNMTKTSVTVQWLWQKQSPTTNVLQYRLVLRGANETSLLFPHQWQHTFHNLQANIKYTVTIYGETTSGNFSRANIEFTTPHLETNEIINTAVPIVLLILAFSIFSVLSRTVYKDYFFPTIANPGQSHIGHWLLNPPYEREDVMNVLKLEDRLTETSLIHIEPRTSLDTECFDEDMTMSKMSLPDNDPMENSDNFENSITLPGFSEYFVLPLLNDHFGYVENCDIQNWAKK
ncbi:uncharacterized protein LOC113656234 isoform X4 [Tachysurus fulvidraco]|uniref:uncharacterized protein LOC113656234 isoform X4 n=1 Tax=Tachysurus fulvidraco TaxID=1234273 RepID=UPI001FED646F|nr:uncharacterized protein LOC113656234 isoform X4 [Tachysurus fulvidraco]